MLLRLIKYFRGYVEVALWGYAPERFLNLCSNHDILIWDLRQEGEVSVLKAAVKKIRNSCDDQQNKLNPVFSVPVTQAEDLVFQHLCVYDDPLYAVPFYMENRH